MGCASLPNLFEAIKATDTELALVAPLQKERFFIDNNWAKLVKYYRAPGSYSILIQEKHKYAKRRNLKAWLAISVFLVMLFSPRKAERKVGESCDAST